VSAKEDSGGPSSSWLGGMWRRFLEYWHTIAAATVVFTIGVELYHHIVSQPWGPWGFAVASGLVIFVAAREERKRSRVGLRRRLGQALVDTVHKRRFPDLNRVLNPDYRASLFVRGGDNWTCFVRSDGTAARCSWKHVENRKELATAGVVVSAAIDGQDFYVVGVPEGRRSDAAECARYYDQARISSQQNDARGWKFSSISASLMRGRHGNIWGVLVVERRSGEPFEGPSTPPPPGRLPASRLPSHSHLPPTGTDVAHPQEAMQDITPRHRSVLGTELQMAIEVASAAWEE
jgi:hypothetical protein